MSEPDAVERNLRAANRVAELVACEMTAGVEGRSIALRLRVIVRASISHPIGGAVEPVDARRGQRQQPADVVRRDEVPRRTHHVGAQDLAGVERPLDGCVRGIPEALADAPFRAAEVLGLHRHEPAHDLRRRPEADP
jgi:hypothetical protein